MVSMAVIIPTRARPTQMSALIEETRRITTAATTWIFAVDDDDPAGEEYAREFAEHAHGMCELVVGPRLRMIPTLNHYAVERAHDFDVLGFMGDDHRPRTEQWDLKIARTVEKVGGVVYGDDKWQGRNLATAAFVDADIVRRLGYMAPERLVHMYADNFWMMLGRETHLTYLADVVIEHMHPDAGKARRDASYDETNSSQTYEHDRVEFDRYVARDWPGERLKLR